MKNEASHLVSGGSAPSFSRVGAGALKRMAVWTLGLIGFIVSAGAENLGYTLALFTAFWLAMLATENRSRNFLHPLVAFPLFYYPYSTWYSYSALLQGTEDLHLLYLSVHYAFAGLLVFYVAGMALLPGRREKNRAPRIRFADVQIGEKAVIGVCLLAIAFSFHRVLEGGFISKRELSDSASSLVAAAGFAFWLLTAVVLLALVRRRHARTKLGRLWFVVVAFFVLEYLLAGQRDYLFRLLICAAFLYFDHRRMAGLPVLLTVLFVVSLLLPLTQMFKAMVIAESLGPWNSELGALFLSEFSSASKNLYVLIQHGFEPSWSFVWSDIVRGLVPFGEVYGFQSTGAWFHWIYRPDEGIGGTSGWGFGLVAQGVLVGGLPGIALVMGSVAVILALLYKRRMRSEYWYVFYLLALSTSLYCIRADLANLLSQTFKVGGLCVLGLYAIRRYSAFLGGGMSAPRPAAAEKAADPAPLGRPPREKAGAR